MGYFAKFKRLATLLAIFITCLVVTQAQAYALSTVGSTTSATATKHSGQRKTFYDSQNSLYWVFCNNGSNIEYFNSSDGSSWTSRGTTAIATSDFSLWYSSNNLYLAYADPSAGLKIQKGSLSSTGISWTGPVSVTSEADHKEVTITSDNSGRLWLAYRDVDGFSWNIRAIRSTNANDISSWDAEKTVASPGSSILVAVPVLVPLTTDDDMYFNWVNDSTVDFIVTVKGRLWDSSTSSFGSITDIQTINSGTPDQGNSVMSSVASSNDTVHLFYHNCSNGVCSQGKLYYAKYSSGSWSSPVLVDSNTTNESPALTINTANGNLIGFYIRSNNIYYRNGSLCVLSPGICWGSETALVQSGTNAYLTSSYRDGNSKAFYIFTQGSSSPYSVKFDSLSL